MLEKALAFCESPTQKASAFADTNHAEGVYITNSEGIAYHQNEVLYIIKLKERYTLTRDEIQPEGLMIYTTLRAVMIYQSCGLDKKIQLERVGFFGDPPKIKHTRCGSYALGRFSRKLENFRQLSLSRVTNTKGISFC